jgi:DNA-binding MarR family transcriptional regulator
MSELADQVWSLMTTVVMDSRGDWRRHVMAQVGLPFSRVRVLRRLADGPLTMKGLAEAAMTDAPAATVAVNDLEKRGLVVRTVQPHNRRVKEVSLTDEGRAVIAEVNAVPNSAPPGICALDEDELTTLGRLLERLSRTE